MIGSLARRALVALGLVIAGACPARADGIGDWLEGVERCAAARPLTLAVAGVEPEQTALSREQAEEARLAIEARLQATGRVRLAASDDVGRIRTLLHDAGALSAERAEAQLRAAVSGDAAVFFSQVSRQGAAAVFRLVAIGADAACKVVSAPVSVPIRIGPGVADIDQIFARSVAALAEAAPEATSVAVCPFRAATGRSTCGAALADRLAIALDAEARSANRVLRSRPLTVVRASEGRCETAGGVASAGLFEHDRAGQSWMSLEFRKGGGVVAPTGRVKISVEALGCDPTMRPFLDHVAATAATDRRKLDVAALANPFVKGQRLDVRISTASPQKLYCWVLAPDETAFVALPVRGASGPEKAAEKTYPRSFGLADIVLDSAFENLFACFGADGPLPEAIEKRWLAAAPSADGEARLLAREDVLDLMDQIRALPGVTEATTRIVVR